MREAIDSALAQTYDNIEILVVNDGSNDNGATDSIAKSYGDKIRYFQKENGGVATALNLAIEYMRGEYFSWLSHDDVYVPDKIEKQVSAIKETGAVFVYGGYRLIDKMGKTIADGLPGRLVPTTSARLHLFRGLIHGCTLLLHRSLFETFGKFEPERKTTQDYALWFRMLREVNTCYIDKVFCLSRVHSEQGSKTISGHNQEADELWSGELARLSEDDCRAMMASAFAFFSTTANFLQSTPYTNAQKISGNLAEQYAVTLEDTSNTTLVSAIIPVYNRVSLAVEAIQSALHQTHKNMEIIVVDDGSTEDTSEIAQLAQQHKNIILHRQKNKGRSAARNAGIALSKGEFIAFLDADDLWMPDKIECQLYEMLHSGALASHTSYVRRYDYSSEEEYAPSGKFTGNLYPQIICNLCLATPTVMIRKDIAPLFKESIHIGEDCIAWIETAQKTCWVGIDKPLAIVRVTRESTAQNLPSRKKGAINILHYLINNNDHSRNDEEIFMAVRYFFSLFDAEQSNEQEGANAEPLLERFNRYYKEHGLVATIVKIFKVIIKKILVK